MIANNSMLSEMKKMRTFYFVSRWMISLCANQHASISRLFIRRFAYFKNASVNLINVLKEAHLNTFLCIYSFALI